ncbi:MAG TPA: uroporphyrinogen-III C-methyltransferase [Methylomirabilota bacterium]|nr:uroporphyrinogen-III C-methyltransferase [Methylomirabilota bacterium]
MSPRGRVALVGAGPGDPGLLTVRGLALIRAADVIVHDRLVNPALLDEAPSAERIDVGKRPGAHTVSQAEIHAILVHHAGRGRFVVRLKGGDPFVFGRGGEEVQALAAAGIAVEVVPGVSAALAAPAAAGIPVTHRSLAASFAVVTGQEDETTTRPPVDWAALAAAVNTLVVLMGSRALPGIARALIGAGRSPETPVALIHAATTPAQATVTATLAAFLDPDGAPALPAPVVAVIGDVVGLRGQLGLAELDAAQAATAHLSGRRAP